MVHEYKYNEHIFKKINVTTDGKNHGLVMVVDWSGSMNGNIKGTIGDDGSGDVFKESEYSF